MSLKLISFLLLVPFRSASAVKLLSMPYVLFNDGNTEAVLLIDKTNAFNNLNRIAALYNIQVLSPSLAPFPINFYRNSAELFADGESILFQEGTIQGDSLAIAMYDLEILLPLIQSVSIAGTTHT